MGNLRKIATQASLDPPLSYLSGTRNDYERTRAKQLEDCILYAFNYGPDGLKPNNFSL